MKRNTIVVIVQQSFIFNRGFSVIFFFAKASPQLVSSPLPRLRPEQTETLVFNNALPKTKPAQLMVFYIPNSKNNGGKSIGLWE